MKSRLLAEVLGTFALVFAGTGAIIVNEVSGGAAHLSARCKCLASLVVPNLGDTRLYATRRTTDAELRA